MDSPDAVQPDPQPPAPSTGVSDGGRRQTVFTVVGLLLVAGAAAALFWLLREPGGEPGEVAMEFEKAQVAHDFHAQCELVAPQYLTAAGYQQEHAPLSAVVRPDTEEGCDALASEREKGVEEGGAESITNWEAEVTHAEVDGYRAAITVHSTWTSDGKDRAATTEHLLVRDHGRWMVIHTQQPEKD